MAKRNIDYLSQAGAVREKTVSALKAQTLLEAGAPVALALSLVDPNPYQPRQDFTAVEAMAADLAANGQDYPILVRQVGARYQVADGETRLRATQLLGVATIQSIIHGYSDEDMATIAFRTAYQRKDLNPMEEALGLKRLLDEFGISVSKLGERLGKTVDYLNFRLRLLKLDPSLAEPVAAGKLSASHAIDLQAIAEPAVRGRVLAEVLERAAAVADDPSVKPMAVKDIRARRAELEAEVHDSEALLREFNRLWRRKLTEADQLKLVETARKLAAKQR